MKVLLQNPASSVMIEFKYNLTVHRNNMTLKRLISINNTCTHACDLTLPHVHICVHTHVQSFQDLSLQINTNLNNAIINFYFKFHSNHFFNEETCKILQ